MIISGRQHKRRDHFKTQKEPNQVICSSYPALCDKGYQFLVVLSEVFVLRSYVLDDCNIMHIQFVALIWFFEKSTWTRRRWLFLIFTGWKIMASCMKRIHVNTIFRVYQRQSIRNEESIRLKLITITIPDIPSHFATSSQVDPNRTGKPPLSPPSLSVSSTFSSP